MDLFCSENTCCVVKIDPHDEKSRLAGQTARKREISKDFSRFFVPAFWGKNTDPFCDFFRPQGSEPAKMGFSKKKRNRIEQPKGLEPTTRFQTLSFFVLVAKCLQIVYYKTSPSLLQEDSNPRKVEKYVFQNRSICHIKGLEPANRKNRPTEDKE